MKRSVYRNRDRPEIASTLYALGLLSQERRDLGQANEQLEESKRMFCRLHGDREDPHIAAIRSALQDLRQAKQRRVEHLRVLTLYRHGNVAGSFFPFQGLQLF